MNKTTKTERPRKQHYFSQRFQSNFCDPDGYFYLYDLTKKVWSDRKRYPNNENLEKNFQMLTDYIGMDPDILEKEIGRDIEANALHEISLIIKNKKLPDTREKLSYIVNLMAIFKERNPLKKKQIIQSEQSKLLKIMQESTVSEEHYNKFMGTMKSNGVIEKIVPYQKAKKFVDGVMFPLELNSDEIIMTMMRNASNLVDELEPLNWTLVEASNDNFIFSDQPIAFFDTSNITNINPMLNTKTTIVFFPISSQLALLGSFLKFPNYLVIDSKIVAGINYSIGFSGASKFYCMKKLTTLPAKENLKDLQLFCNQHLNEY